MKEQVLRILRCKDIRLLPECVMTLLQGDRSVRDEAYRELIGLYSGDLSYDWFTPIYMQDMAECKTKGQHFTPTEVTGLVNALVPESDGGISGAYEPSAGTGAMIIARWWYLASKRYPWDFRPSTCIFRCWDISDRAIPILLLNLSIRGMMAEVLHGDPLEQQVVNRYVVLNENDDPLAFSDIVVDNSLLVSLKGRGKIL